jgi:nitrogen fixation NifU-like protein
VPPNDTRHETRADAHTDSRSEAELGAIYQELILDHYRRPRNKGTVDAPGARTARRKNPLCGDEIAVSLALDDRGRVTDVRFTGQGCSISQASASMLTEVVRGKTREEAAALLDRFRAMMHGDRAAAADASLGELRALSGVARFPTRVQCATLAWSALAEIL